MHTYVCTQMQKAQNRLHLKANSVDLMELVIYPLGAHLKVSGRRKGSRLGGGGHGERLETTATQRERTYEWRRRGGGVKSRCK